MLPLQKVSKSTQLDSLDVALERNVAVFVLYNVQVNFCRIRFHKGKFMFQEFLVWGLKVRVGINQGFQWFNQVFPARNGKQKRMFYGIKNRCVFWRIREIRLVFSSCSRNGFRRGRDGDCICHKSVRQCRVGMAHKCGQVDDLNPIRRCRVIPARNQRR